MALVDLGSRASHRKVRPTRPLSAPSDDLASAVHVPEYWMAGVVSDYEAQLGQGLAHMPVGRDRCARGGHRPILENQAG